MKINKYKKYHKYILLTSAYNEERNIEKTINSVISQTILPSNWIIISDGSTDNTDEIIKKYKKLYEFISYFRIEKEKIHNFGFKVNAINYALKKVKKKRYDFIGILDADVQFDADYYETILSKFDINSCLGIGGGQVLELINNKIQKRIKTNNSVAGAVQLFRKKCFENTQGFLPFQYGGEDAAIEIEARMNGWIVQTFPEIKVIHNGPVGGNTGGYLKYRFKRGISFFTLGYLPTFHLIRCLYRLRERPFFIGSIAELTGYFFASIKFKNPTLSEKVTSYLRNEQKNRIKKLLFFKV